MRVLLLADEHPSGWPPFAVRHMIKRGHVVELITWEAPLPHNGERPDIIIVTVKGTRDDLMNESVGKVLTAYGPIRVIAVFPREDLSLLARAMLAGAVVCEVHPYSGEHIEEMLIQTMSHDPPDADRIDRQHGAWRKR